MEVKLERFYLGGEATMGRLTLPSGVLLFTIERPWFDNKPGISCIPEGSYPMVPRPFFRGGYDAYEIVGVPNRHYILIHIANWAKDVQGCIGVGLNYDLGKFMVTESKRAFARFMQEMDGAPGRIEITSVRALFNG